MTTANLTGFRLSPQQRLLWRAGASAPVFAARCCMTIEGELDRGALERALEAAVERHEALRTHYRQEGGVRWPIQVVAEGGEVAWEGAVAGEAQAAGEESSGGFELDRGALLCCRLDRLAEGRHRLTLRLPALCADHAGLHNLAREIARLYAGAATDDDPVQHLDFTEWQNGLLEDEDAAAGVDFWRQQPRFDPSAPVLGFEPRSVPGELSLVRAEARLGAETSERIDACLAALGVGADAFFLAAVALLLWRLDERSRITLGTAFDGRKAEELEAVVGLLARHVPVGVEITRESTFAALARAFEAARLETADWQEYFAAADFEGLRLPAVAVDVIERPEAIRAGDLRFTIESTAVCYDPFKLRVTAVEEGGRWHLQVDADARSYTAGDAADVASRLEQVVAAVVVDPEASLDGPDVLVARERLSLVETFNATRSEHTGEPFVHRWIARQARRTPEAEAVRCGERALTYRELDRAADALAASLAAQGIGPGALVGLALERSPELMVALLGVLKAGAAYLPLDLTHPRRRLAAILEEARPPVVLTLEAQVASLPGWGGRTLALDAAGSAAEPTAALEPVEVSPDDLAYVLYTSGSTGRPKGVMVSHRALHNYLAWSVEAYAAAEGHGAPVHSPIGFDLSVTSLFTPLMCGKTTLLLSEADGVEALGNALRRGSGFSMVKLTPAHFELLIGTLTAEELGGCTHFLVLGGEPLPAHHLVYWQTWAPEARLVNEYGPTEATVGCCAFELSAETEVFGTAPIGRPIANARMYALDRRLRPVPTGVVGELFIGGAGLARGYLGRPAQTAERFVPDPFAAEPGSRLYRSGDLGRFLRSGDLSFVGRNDHQVKLRGVRIELGEVAVALRSHPSVTEAVVVLREDVPGDRRLVAYLTAAAGAALGADELRSFLAERLPEQMVPSFYVVLDALPLTPNGKVDRSVLPLPGSQRPELEQALIAPETPVEIALAEIWSQVLGIDEIGLGDGFFALGGDSIRSVQVVSFAKERGLELSVPDLFQYQTLRELAQAVEGRLTHGEVEGDDADLGLALDELEQLPDDEVERRLRQQLGSTEEGAR